MSVGTRFGECVFVTAGHDMSLDGKRLGHTNIFSLWDGCVNLTVAGYYNFPLRDCSRACHSM